jgi:serine/threonine protein kinase
MPEILDRLRTALAARYRIQHELGGGGMSTVYLAEDLKHRRNVAIKVLRPDLAAVLGTQRFLQEVEIAAQLTHPHILGLIDSGEADGLLYYVMPYIEGEPLKVKLVREGELPVQDAVRILRDVADALAHAHSRGVIHRDIKPGNVLLSGRHALVTDFGVATWRRSRPRAIPTSITGRISMPSGPWGTSCWRDDLRSRDLHRERCLRHTSRRHRSPWGCCAPAWRRISRPSSCAASRRSRPTGGKRPTSC